MGDHTAALECEQSLLPFSAQLCHSRAGCGTHQLRAPDVDIRFVDAKTYLSPVSRAIGFCTWGVRSYQIPLNAQLYRLVLPVSGGRPTRLSIDSATTCLLGGQEGFLLFKQRLTRELRKE